VLLFYPHEILSISVDKPRNAHKKRKDQRVPNDKSKSSQEVEEATMEDIYQISSGEEDCSQGMKSM